MNEVFSKRLKDALDLRNVTQRELASRIGLTEVAVSRYANGLRMPRADVFFEICEVLNVSPDFLMGKTRGVKV